MTARVKGWHYAKLSNAYSVAFFCGQGHNVHLPKISLGSLRWEPSLIPRLSIKWVKKIFLGVRLLEPSLIKT